GRGQVKPFLPPFLFNLLVLVPVGLTPLSGGAAGGPMACPGKFPESEGFRTVLGSLRTTVLIGSVLGLFFPASMSPLLLTQVIYRTLWLLGFVLPRLVGGGRRGSPGHFADVPGNHR